MEVLFPNLSVFEQFLPVLHSVFNFTLVVASVRTCEKPNGKHRRRSQPLLCGPESMRKKNMMHEEKEAAAEWKTLSLPRVWTGYVYSCTQINSHMVCDYHLDGLVDSIIPYIRLSLRRNKLKLIAHICTKVTSQLRRLFVLLSRRSEAPDIKSSTYL